MHDGAQHVQVHRGTHSIAYSLAIANPREYTGLEVPIDICLRLDLGNTTHHCPVSSAHHPPKGRVETQVIKGLLIVHTSDARGIVTVSILTTIEI